MIKTIPLTALQTAIFKCLKQGQTVSIYGDVPTKAKLPYITIGVIVAKPYSVKDVNLWEASINIDVWATKEDKKLVNETLTDICYIITYLDTRIPIEGYAFNSVSIETVEAFAAEGGGYHGTVTINCELQETR